MTTFRTILTTALVWSALSGTAFAQSAAPITSDDVVGQWQLLLAPGNSEEVQVNVEGDEPDFELVITRQPDGSIVCDVVDQPNTCIVQNGALTITVPVDSGAAEMIFTLDRRSADGFSGSAKVRAAALPSDVHFGTLTMTRP